MKQAVAGVRPAEVEEAPVMTVYPSVAATAAGRIMGQLCAIRMPDIYIFRLGNLFALMAIPLGLALYFGRLAPSFYSMTPAAGCYRLTNRRVVALRNEIHHEPRRFLGWLLGILAAIIGFVVCGLLLAIFLPDMWWFWWVLICLLVGGVGAVIPYCIGCWRFDAFREGKSVRLDAFDTIEIDVRPGQDWHHAGDLVFRSGATETFRLDGVSRPEAFRQSCLHARSAYNGVRRAATPGVHA